MPGPTTRSRSSSRSSPASTRTTRSRSSSRARPSDADPKQSRDLPPSIPQFSLSRPGDALNLLVVMNSVLYLAFFITNHLGLSSTMDPTTKALGFCVSSPTSPIWNSHALSFYADVALSLLSLLLLLLHPAKPGDASETGKARVFMSRSIAGTLGHGLGHLFLSLASTSPVTSPEISFLSLPLHLQIFSVPGILFFWYSLLGTNEYIPRPHLVLYSALHSAALLSGVLPATAGFTYVQSILVLTFTFYDVFVRPPRTKTLAYDLSPLVSLPFSVVAWLEGLACSGRYGIGAFGGHVWYDAGIAGGILLYYLFVRWLDNNGEPKKKKKKKSA